MIRRWFSIGVLLAMLCGTVLSLPACWARPVIGQKSSQIALHWLDCVFTAMSALTATGLSRHDIAEDFNFAGQAIILGLMQAGGLGALVLGCVVGLRFRRRFGWGADDETAARMGLPRLIVFVCALSLLLEAVGAVALYRGPPVQSGGQLFAAVFHSVSAFCNTGLTLTQDSLISQAGSWPPYAVALPLMIIGSLGGPVLHELWRKLLRSRTALSLDSRVTLIGMAALIVAGAGMIFLVESTPRWQLRNPREDAERIRLADAPQDEEIIFSSGDSARVKGERMRTMNAGRRLAAAIFHSVSSRTTGFYVARLDEQSIAPADRAAMMILMLVGGGLGGTAGGLRIVVVVLLLGTLLRIGPETTPPLKGQDAHPPEDPRGGRALLLRAATAIAAAMFLLIGGTALALIYREVGTTEACLFESVSACCNVGVSAGLTRQLSPEGQAIVILAMLLGRIIPPAMLANYLSRAAGAAPSGFAGSSGAFPLVSVPE